MIVTLFIFGLMGCKGDSSTLFGLLADSNGSEQDAALAVLVGLANQPTTPPAIDETPPEFAGIYSAQVVDSNTVLLNWAPPATDDTTATSSIIYDVYYSSTSGVQDFLAAPLASSNPGAASIQVTLASADSTPYYFVVRARDEAGNQESNNIEKSQIIFKEDFEDTATISDWSTWWKSTLNTPIVTIDYNNTVTSPIASSTLNGAVSGSFQSTLMGVTRNIPIFSPSYLAFYLRGKEYQCSPFVEFFENGVAGSDNVTPGGILGIKIACNISGMTNGNIFVNNVDSGISCASETWHFIELINFGDGIFDVNINDTPAMTGVGYINPITNGFDMISLFGYSCNANAPANFDEIIIY